MFKSYLFLPILFISLFFSACSSSKTLVLSPSLDDFKTSKIFCTSTANLDKYHSSQLHQILLEEAKNDILFEFLENNSITNSAYSDLKIIDMIKISYEKFEMNDDFTDYCLEIDAKIINTRKIQDEIVVEDFCNNFCQKNL